MLRKTLSAAFLFAPAAVRAHEGQPLAPHDLPSAWVFEPWVVLALALSAILYSRGTRTMQGASSRERSSRRRESICFAVGWLVLALALVSPLHALGASLFSAHMAQHELLMVISAPLIVMSRPMVAALWAVPLQWRRAIGNSVRAPAFRKVWLAVSAPAMAWLIHALAIWGWHVPGLYQETLTSELAHSLQHASFFVTALLFWWAVIHGRAGRMGHGAAVLYVFTTAMHTSILGALIAFSNTPWYPIYGRSSAVWGLSVLEDQQLAGLIMWIPAGLAYAVVGLWLLASWLRESDRRVKLTERVIMGATR